MRTDPKTTKTFPFLGGELDEIENIPSSRLSCWLHCLRDALYYYGFCNATQALVQPLNFEIEFDTHGELLTIFGGLDTNYENPRFYRGVAATWKHFSNPKEALDLVCTSLDEGRVVPANLVFSTMAYSKWHRVSFYGYPHTALIYDIDVGTEMASLADIQARPRSEFADNRGRVSLEDLSRGLTQCALLDWRVQPTEMPVDREFYTLLDSSINNMVRPGRGIGLGGILDLPEVIGDLSSHKRRRTFLRFRIAAPLIRQLSGDRLIFARMVEKAPHTRRSSDLLELLVLSSDTWAELSRTIFLFSEVDTKRVPKVIVERVQKIYTIESQALELLTELRSAL